MRTVFEVILKQGREIPILSGHPWIFSNALQFPEKDMPATALVRIKAHDGAFIGMGLLNRSSSIRVRMVSLNPLDFLDIDFFIQRLKGLEEAKLRFMPPQTSGYRIANADNDYLPGLIIDRYGDVLVFQIHSAAMDEYREVIIEALQKAFDPQAIVERSDVGIRREEGLKTFPVACHRGEVPSQVVFEENGLLFAADPMSGQKTGFFLDQRDSRQAVRRLSAGRRVLNLFGYTGAFSVYAMSGGARQVVTVDSSRSALSQVQVNYQLNNLGAPDLVCTDVLGYLGQIRPGDHDLIICDPPAFAKTQQKADSALKAYQSLNKRCFSLLRSRGILVTSSCSGRISQTMFIDMLRHAAGNARKDARILAILGEPVDHTHRLAFPEGSYLKTVILEIL